jgi:hypothetical protein
MAGGTDERGRASHRHIDTGQLLIPMEVLMTRFLMVRDVSRARGFSADLFADIEASYREWLVRGAHVLTAPLDRSAEIRCSMGEPDGCLIEVGQTRGVLEGGLAEQPPAGSEAGRADGR